MAFFSLLSPRSLRRFLLLAGPVLGLLSSCTTTRYYRQRTMFQLTQGRDGAVDTAKLRRVVNRTARNYHIHANDVLNVQVFTNKGERIIDPNGELRFGPAGTGNVTSPTLSTTIGQRNGSQAPSQVPGSTQFLVQADGTVRLPLVDRVPVRGLSLVQADSVLRLRYNEYYKDSFVKTAVTNNRVVMLGSLGGQVITLPNDNMSLLEVLALAGGADNGGGASGFARYGGRMDNIRIIRGDLKNPQVQFVNLSTLEGMRRGNLQVEPNDIIYIEPVRRPLQDGLVDAGPVFTAASAVLSAISLIFTIYIINKQRNP